jgi:hypothetical protein
MIKKAICIVIAVSLSATATAGVKVSVTSYPAIGDIASWPAEFTDTITEGGNPAPYNQVENNYGEAAPYSFAQSWTATKTGILSHIQIIIGGTPPVSFNINLYDANEWDGQENSPSDWSDVGDAGVHTYKPGVNVTKNLFSKTLAVTWVDFNNPSDKVAVLDIAFTDEDMAAITSGHQYIFEITAETNPSGMIWYRNGASGANYEKGQAFRQGSPLNGNNQRDFTLAATVISKSPAPAPTDTEG